MFEVLWKLKCGIYVLSQCILVCYNQAIHEAFINAESHNNTQSGDIVSENSKCLFATVAY
jgi:hypothetical protein